MFCIVLDYISVNKKRSVSSTSDTDPLKKKLNEVLSEGLLDSVLPYLVQNATSLKKSAAKTQGKSSN